MEKAQVTTELIGLRGGLSLLSKYTDDIKAQEKEVEDAVFELESLKNQCESIKQDIEKSKEDYKAKVAEIQERQEKIKRKQKSAKCDKGAAREVISKIDWGLDGWGWAFEGPGLLASFIMYVWALTEGKTFEAMGTIGMTFYIIGIFAGAFLYPIIRTIMWIVRRRRKYASVIRAQISRYNEELSSMQDDLKQAEENLKEMPIIINRRKIDLENTEKKIAQQEIYLSEKQESSEKEIASIAMNSQTLTAALADTYGFVISQSDWCNVDMIVHYLETGRADTIKEALQQVDQQRQTDQIARSITMASEAMQDHIESAFTRMGQALAEGFNRLDRSIQSVSRSIWSSQRDMIRSNEELRLQLTQKLEQQIDVSEMQNVLLEKSNKTSDDLLNDLRYNQRFWVK